MSRRRRLTGPLWACVFALIVIAFCPALERPGESVREALLLFGAPLLFAAAVVSGRWRPGLVFSALFGWAVLFGAFGVFSAPDPERLTVFRDLLVLASPWLVAAGAASFRPDDHDQDRWIEAGAIAALTLAGLAGLAQAWLGWTGVEQSYPPAATFMNKNVAAQALVVLVPLALPSLLTARRVRVRWVAAAAAGVGLAFLIATRARGAWLALLVGLAVAAVAWSLSTRAVRSTVRFAPLTLVVALALVATIVPTSRVAGALPSVGGTIRSFAQVTEGSGAIRLALWRNTLAMIGDHPVTGIGAGRFPVVYPLYNRAVVETPKFGPERQAEHAHGDLLEYAAELGPAAALALAALLSGGCLLAFRGSREATRPEDLVRRCAWLAVVAGAAAHGLVSFPLHSPASALVVWLVVGRCWATTGRASEWKRPRLAVIVAALAVSLFGLWLGLQEMRSQTSLRDAVVAVGARDCPAALKAAGSVGRHAPWRRREAGIAAMAVFECEEDPVASLAPLEDALSRHPHQINLLLAVGARRLKAGRVAEAQDAYGHATEIVPSYGRAWVGLAMTRVALGDREGAVEACRSALEAEPGLQPALEYCSGLR